MRHRIRLCALALTLTLPPALGTGCGDPAPDPKSATASATSPADLCTAIITKWARQIYESGDSGGSDGSGGSAYGDYQSMGLSNGQYLILRDILDAARAERRRETATAGRELITRQARERCAERYRGGGPSDGPWV
ncbi:hypothetical protein [Streptomyces sp. NPDC003006]